jgi:hypothetical protein
MSEFDNVLEEIKQREVIRLKRAPKKREKYNLDEI